jgi:hypothetical protein
MYQVEEFKYNGFSVQPKSQKRGWGHFESYTAEFKNWTNDPGIANCICSDRKERLIPSCCLVGDKSNLPKQSMENKVLFGVESIS